MAFGSGRDDVHSCFSKRSIRELPHDVQSLLERLQRLHLCILHDMARLVEVIMVVLAEQPDLLLLHGNEALLVEGLG